MLTLFTSVLVALAGFAAAQNSSSSFDPKSVDLTQRSQWCQGEHNNCPLLCGGAQFMTTNLCSAADATYKCICSNGTEPTDIAQYLNTWPNYVCQETFAQCRQATPGSESCKTCGTLQVKNVPTMTSTMAAATTAMATGGSMTTGTTGTAASPAATTGAAAEKIVPVGFLGLIGLLLL